MRKPQNKIEFVKGNSVEVSSADKMKNIGLPSTTLASGKPSIPMTQTTSITRIPGGNSMNPLVVIEVIKILSDAITGFADLGIKIQETKQMKERTRQIVAQAEVLINQEQEATKRLKLQLENEKHRMDMEMKKHGHETELRIREIGIDSALKSREMDDSLEKFKLKMNEMSNYLNNMIESYNRIDILLNSDPETRSSCIEERRSIRQNLLNVLSTIAGM